jgi:hypothetical protein
MVFGVLWLAVIVLFIAGLWKVFTKAGKPGWASIVPIYNLWVLLEIAGRPGFWLLLLLIPLINFVIYIMVCVDVARSFSKGAGFGIGLLCLPMVFFPMLGFGSARYIGARTQSAAPETRAAGA